MVEVQLRILGTGLGGIQVPLTLRDGSIHTSKRLLQMGGEKAEKEPVRLGKVETIRRLSCGDTGISLQGYWQSKRVHVCVTAHGKTAAWSSWFSRSSDDNCFLLRTRVNLLGGPSSNGPFHSLLCSPSRNSHYWTDYGVHCFSSRGPFLCRSVEIV